MGYFGHFATTMNIVAKPYDENPTKSTTFACVYSHHNNLNDTVSKCSDVGLKFIFLFVDLFKETYFYSI